MQSFAETSSPTKMRNFEAANVQGAIGDTGSLYLSPPGMFINPLYNDFFGDTDKLLTASFTAGLLRLYSDTSFEMTTNWRFLTPVYKQAFGQPDLPVPVGRFADWMELSSAYAWTDDLKVGKRKGQIDLGLGHVGNKGAKQIHYWVHQITHNSLDHLDYSNQPSGVVPSIGYSTAYISPEEELGTLHYQKQVSAGLHHNEFMTEAFLAANLVTNYRPGYELGLESRLIIQLNSSTYESILPYRYEMAAGVLLFRYYKPTIKYVSEYIRGDAFGQVYLDFFNVYIPF